MNSTSLDPHVLILHSTASGPLTDHLFAIFAIGVVLLVVGLMVCLFPTEEAIAVMMIFVGFAMAVVSLLLGIWANASHTSRLDEEFEQLLPTAYPNLRVVGSLSPSLGDFDAIVTDRDPDKVERCRPRVGQVENDQTPVIVICDGRAVPVTKE